MGGRPPNDLGQLHHGWYEWDAYALAAAGKNKIDVPPHYQENVMWWLQLPNHVELNQVGDLRRKIIDTVLAGRAPAPPLPAHAQPKI